MIWTSYAACLLSGVFVHVFRHPDEKPLLGFLPRFLFAEGARLAQLASARLHEDSCMQEGSCQDLSAKLCGDFQSKSRRRVESSTMHRAAADSSNLRIVRG